MNRIPQKLSLVFLLTFIALFFAVNAKAQQTIFNVPSTDILNKGGVYLEFGATFKPNRENALGKFSSFVPRAVFGVGNNTEVGVNLLGNVQPGADVTIVSPTIKRRVYQNEKRGVDVVVGDNLFIPVRRKTYNIGNYSYVAASKTYRKTGTRVTSGAYHFTKNVVAENAHRAGGQFGVEQPINRRIGFAADWLTGKHAAGYLTAGFNFKASRRVVAYAGYSIGNHNASRGNHFFYTSVGINLF